MALTKAVEAIDEWANVGQNAVRKGAVADVSSNFAETILHIDMALTSATAHTGTRIEVQVSSNTTGDEDWSTLVELVGPTGTANVEAIDNDPLASGSTLASCASTTGYVADGAIFIYFKDGTIANSEMVYLISAVTDTSVTWLDETTNEHAQGTNMYNIAKTYTVSIPFGIYRARVIIDNTYDVNGSPVDTKTRLSKVTAVS